MRRSDYHIETIEHEGLKIQIFQDDSPQHPDEGSDDVFIVSFSNDFYIVRKNTWDDVGDFRDFIHPRFQVDGWDPNEDMPEPAAKPVDGPEDAVWRGVYTSNCTNQVEALLLEAGEDSDFDNDIGKSMAHENYCLRSDIWDAWQRYKAAHAEWACFTLDVRNYGGGHIRLAMGDTYDGSDTDRWGDPRDPDGFVMVKKSAGWHNKHSEVGESVVKEWQAYCDGEVYGYVIEDEEEQVVDSCWGYIGDLQYCKEEAMANAKAHDQHRRKQMTLPFKQPDTGQAEASNG